jgi:hypothetical protein
VNEVQRPVAVPLHEDGAEGVVDGVGTLARCGQPCIRQQVRELADHLVAGILDKAIVADPASLAEEMRGRFLLDRALGKAPQVEIARVLRNPAGHDEGQPEGIRVFAAARAARSIAARGIERISRKLRTQQQMLDHDQPLVGAPCAIS